MDMRNSGYMQYLKVIFPPLLSVSLIITGWFLCRSFLVYQDLKTRSIPLIISSDVNGEVTLRGYVFLEGDTWEYFRGMPFIEIHGINFPQFFRLGGKVSFEIQNQNTSTKILIDKNKVVKKKINLCGGKNLEDDNTYRLFPSSIIYMKNGRFIDIQHSYTLNYKKGINIITIQLQNFLFPIENFSGEIILDALEKRVLSLFPLCYMLFFMLFSLVLWVIYLYKLNKFNPMKDM